MNEMTTAQALGAYRRELIAEGFTEDAAFELARDAAHAIVRNGEAFLAVKRDEDAGVAA